MTPDEIFDSFNNAWKAQCQIYREHPTQESQSVLNALSRIIDKVYSEYTKANEVKTGEGQQISMEEWLKFFQE